MSGVGLSLGDGCCLRRVDERVRCGGDGVVLLGVGRGLEMLLEQGTC